MREFKLYGFQINELINFVNENLLTKHGAPLINYLNQIKNQEILPAQTEQQDKVSANDDEVIADQQAIENPASDIAVIDQEPVAN
jgi:hypothetical protein